ncbi:MAG: hypothetical protein M3354_06465 [Chloroflexota bacterium]|nr:hypothetical protein [Chloroflexota bacterium]
MTAEHHTQITPAVEAALSKIQARISEHFPQATFAVEEGFDPKGIYLVVTVDVADTDEVTDLVGDRLVDLQVEAGLPIYLAPLRPIERVVADLRAREVREPLAPLAPLAPLPA